MTPPTLPSGLRDAFASPDRQQAVVDWVFDRVAPRYDLGNDLMSAGWHTRWKRRLIEKMSPEPGARVVDLACGTGDVTWMLAARGCEVIGVDNNPNMLALAPSKRPDGCPPARFVEADAAALPLEDGSADLVTCVYAGRGFPDFDAVLREAHRVLRPGGHFWNLDFARPPRRIVDRAYRGYLLASGAVLGTVLHGHPKTYMYIPVSMRAYPGQRWLHERLTAVGFEADLEETFAGLMAYNHGVKRS